MMDWTDRHCRTFHRLLSRGTLLYTEMVTSAAVLHGPRDRLLGFGAHEHPVALQLGGSDPAELATAARIAAEWGYDEINLNVGCPSDRVQAGRFGACLMAEPELVARCVGAMRDAVAVPVTVKSRIAIDAMEEWPTLERFVRTVSAAGVGHFIVHARKAWLKGLSPKENRDVPPLRYDLVHRLKREYPHLAIVINGGIRTLDAAAEHLGPVDGVMIGRAAYETPYILADADRRFFGGPPGPDRHAVVEAMLPYAEAQVTAGTPLACITRHMLGLFQGLPGARAWRRHLSENAHRPGAGPDLLRQAAALVPREVVPAV
ncbi:tRNA dihydrouridine(20/20a) synthase DusA [Azospirillum halopraeferens]|uniref:tRNA dihydrouridine(20/20a) synthase DusA n=1 Tax=Azospirillum halopraeferens TaxID=34010 RepID=UPI0009FE6702|nr:tRNA dihydrouridine(20/20a) synthase DusA [Azospirillum halopraeferens]